jgi:hypothetical protein
MAVSVAVTTVGTGLAVLGMLGWIAAAFAAGVALLRRLDVS